MSLKNSSESETFNGLKIHKNCWKWIPNSPSHKAIHFIELLNTFLSWDGVIALFSVVIWLFNSSTIRISFWNMRFLRWTQRKKSQGDKFRLLCDHSPFETSRFLKNLHRNSSISFVASCWNQQSPSNHSNSEINWVMMSRYVLASIFIALKSMYLVRWNHAPSLRKKLSNIAVSRLWQEIKFENHSQKQSRFCGSSDFNSCTRVA